MASCTPNMANGRRQAAEPGAIERRPAPAAGLRRRRGSNLPRELAYLAPILRERSRIEALAAALIDLLDSFDAPLEDLEAEEDCCQADEDRGTFSRRFG